MGYRIKSVARLTGVPRETLLAWERRYKVVTPSRLANGYREYSESEVETLTRLKALVDTGHKVGEAVSLLRDEGPREPPPGVAAPIVDCADQLYDALVAFDEGRAQTVVTSLRGVPFAQQVCRVYLPVLRRVGTAWAMGQATVLQEHFVSAFCRTRMMEMFTMLQTNDRTGPHVICACAPTEDHDLGLLGTAVLLSLKGYRVSWLGARCPADELLSLVAHQRPDLVCLAAVCGSDPKELLAQVRSLSAVLSDHAKLVVGGADVADLVGTSVPKVEWHTKIGGLISA